MGIEPMEGSRIPILSDADIVTARQHGRILAMGLGFKGSDLTVVATAISEVARNIVSYAETGEILLRPVRRGGTPGLTVIAADKGPGIQNLAMAMQDGYSTGNSLGLGLPGARRLMDEFEIETELGVGTTITMTKWVR